MLRAIAQRHRAPDSLALGALLSLLPPARAFWCVGAAVPTDREAGLPLVQVWPLIVLTPARPFRAIAVLRKELKMTYDFGHLGKPSRRQK